MLIITSRLLCHK